MDRGVGRGANGGTWTARADVAVAAGYLYCSIVLRPDCAPAVALQLGFVAALEVAETVAPLLDDRTRLRLKWPNDVMLDGRKLAGILPEASVVGARAEWLVLGIGINVVSHPEDAGVMATDLAAADVVSRPEALLPALLASLMSEVTAWRDGGFGEVRQSWLSWAMPVGSDVSVRLGSGRDGGVTAGRFGGLDDSGALLLASDDGTRIITVGEVFAGVEANET